MKVVVETLSHLLEPMRGALPAGREGLTGGLSQQLKN